MTSPFQRVAKAIASDLPGLSPSEADTLIGLLRQGQPQPPFPSYPVNVDYSASVEQLIKAGKYDWFNDDITGRNFPSSEKGTAQVIVYLVNFDRDISSENAVKELDRQGLRPATLKELLALGATYPDLQRKDLIVALGSTWRPSDGDVSVPDLDGDGSLRSLHLGWWGGGWRSHWRFAAVRK
jgi:hypothetical protein